LELTALPRVRKRKLISQTEIARKKRITIKEIPKLFGMVNCFAEKQRVKR
jgi:hypothetical protein